MSALKRNWIKITNFCEANPPFKPDSIRLIVRQHREKLNAKGCLMRVGNTQYLDEDLFTEMMLNDEFARPNR